MNRRHPLLHLALVGLFALITCSAAFAQDPNVDKAEEFINLLSKKQFNEAYKKLDSNLGFKLKSGEKLAGPWNNLVKKAGPFKKFWKHDVEVVNGNGMTYTIVKYLCKFENGFVNIVVALDGRGTIADFRFSNYDGPPIQVDEGKPVAEGEKKAPSDESASGTGSGSAASAENPA